MINLSKGARIARKTTYYIRGFKYEIKKTTENACMLLFNKIHVNNSKRISLKSALFHSSPIKTLGQPNNF